MASSISKLSQGHPWAKNRGATRGKVKNIRLDKKFQIHRDGKFCGIYWVERIHPDFNEGFALGGAVQEKKYKQLHRKYECKDCHRGIEPSECGWHSYSGVICSFCIPAPKIRGRKKIDTEFKV